MNPTESAAPSLLTRAMNMPVLGIGIVLFLRTNAFSRLLSGASTDRTM